MQTHSVNRAWPQPQMNFSSPEGKQQITLLRFALFQVVLLRL